MTLLRFQTPSDDESMYSLCARYYRSHKLSHSDLKDQPGDIQKSDTEASTPSGTEKKSSTVVARKVKMTRKKG